MAGRLVGPGFGRAHWASTPVLETGRRVPARRGRMGGSTAHVEAAAGEPAERAPEVEVREVGDEVPRKGRARRFREARELKQGFDDGLFSESGRSLADADEGGEPHSSWLDDDEGHGDDWDEDDPLRIDEGGRPESPAGRPASSLHPAGQGEDHTVRGSGRSGSTS
jgi:hypothetical protein